jgi:hypothetical protein
MPEKQWLYWLVAVPLTMIVVGISLHMAGELRTLLDWAASLFPSFRPKGAMKPSTQGPAYKVGSGYPEPPPFFPRANVARSESFLPEPNKERFSLRPMGAFEMLRRGMAREAGQRPAELNA